ncbi:MAG: phospholipase phosphocholine-specific, partial [Sediminibacterium sp.]|nr:phospholipase phosphocholine-specific [Sediminibacterium sp.]
VPSNYRKLSAADIAEANQNTNSSLLPKQENGTRSSNALPYELYSHCNISKDKRSVTIRMKSGNNVFGKKASGSPFQIFAQGKYKQELVRTWDYAVVPGDTLQDNWEINDFENGQYHLRVYGPNGFSRAFMGNQQDPELAIACSYEHRSAGAKTLSGNIAIQLTNNGSEVLTIEIADNAYATGKRTIVLSPSGTAKAKQTAIVNLQKSFGWYDLSVSVKGNEIYQQVFAGRVETGRPSKTDPLMGRVI